MSEQSDFHETTFLPVEDTSVDTQDTDSTITNSETDQTQQNSETDTSKETNKADEQKDNWEVRAKHWQSEAYKRENLIREREAEAQRLRQELEAKNKPAEPELKRPQRPKASHEEDPTAWVVYGAELAEYNAAVQEAKDKREAEKEQQYLQYQQVMQQKNQTLGTLTQYTNNPEKSAKIFDFFYNFKENLNNPSEYEVMYDAIMASRSGKKSPVKMEKAPPPPTGGGKTITEKVTPEDAFNQQLGQSNRYKL